MDRVALSFQIKLSQSINFYKLCLFSEPDCFADSKYCSNTRFTNVSDYLRKSHYLYNRLLYMKLNSGIVSKTIILTSEMVRTPNVDNPYCSELPDLLDVGLRVCLIADCLRGSVDNMPENYDRRDSRLLALYDYVAENG